MWEVLIGKKHGSARWFGGQRTNLRWMASTKSHAARTGCMIMTAPGIPDQIVARFSDVLLSDIYCGSLPKKVTNDPAHRPFSDGRSLAPGGSRNTPRFPCGFDLAADRTSATSARDRSKPCLTVLPEYLELTSGAMSMTASWLS
jgi:hypothetical protein